MLSSVENDLAISLMRRWTEKKMAGLIALHHWGGPTGKIAAAIFLYEVRQQLDARRPDGSVGMAFGLASADKLPVVVRIPAASTRESTSATSSERQRAPTFKKKK